MTRAQTRQSLVALWLLLATATGVAFTPDNASGWLTWAVFGIGLPLGLWIVTAPEPLTMSQAIQRGRD